MTRPIGRELARTSAPERRYAARIERGADRDMIFAVRLHDIEHVYETRQTTERNVDVDIGRCIALSRKPSVLHRCALFPQT